MENRQRKTSVNKNTVSGYKMLNPGIIEKLRIFILVMLSIFIFYPPFVRGLYFEEEQLVAEIFIFTVFAIFWAYKYFINDRRFLKTPLDYAALAFVGIYFIAVALYFVGVQIAVSPRLHTAEWLKYCMYFAVFYMVSELINTYKIKRMLLWITSASTVGLCILGFDGATGNTLANLINSIFTLLGFTTKIFDTFVSNRIYSTIQYANAFAAYLMAVFFIIICLIVTSDKLRSKIIGGIASFIVLNTFLYTQSRGVQVLFPLAVLLFMLILPKGLRVRSLAYSISSGITVGLLIVFGLLKYMANNLGNEGKIWFLLALGVCISFVGTLLTNYLMKYIEKYWKVFLTAFLVLLITVISGIIVAFNSATPLRIEHPVGKSVDSHVWREKDVVLEPSKEYKLIFSVQASMEQKDKPNAYFVRITNKTSADIVLYSGETLLGSIEGKQTSGIEKKEIKFKVPPETELVSVYFTNTYVGTDATYYDAKIIDESTGKVVKDFVLNYKYIPVQVASKLENATKSNSFLERSVYYKDALKMIKDRWFLGAGGGAWTQLNFSYQSYLYWSTQAHNYILQLAIEVGILGIFALLFLIICIKLLFLREYIVKSSEDDMGERVLQAGLATAIFAILLHASVIDFDLSISSVALLLWQCLGMFNSRYKNDLREIDIDTRGYKWFGKFDIINKARIINMSPIIGGVIVLLILILPINFKTASDYAQKAVELSKTDLYSSIKYMKNASTTDTMMPQYKLDYVNLLISNPQNNYIILENLKSAEKLCYYSSDLMAKVGLYYMSIGQIDEGLSAFNRATGLRPLRPEEWEQKVNAYYSVVAFCVKGMQYSDAVKYIDRCLTEMNGITEINKNTMRPVEFNSKTKEMLSKLKDVKNSIELNKPVTMD